MKLFLTFFIVLIIIGTALLVLNFAEVLILSKAVQALIFLLNGFGVAFFLLRGRKAAKGSRG
jgi:hypothetical protein